VWGVALIWVEKQMQEAIQQLLEELEAHGRANDARETDRARKMLNLEPGTAQLLSILLRSSGATRVLEVGTSNGYSTIWLAWSLARSGPAEVRMISIERNPDKQVLARENLHRAGLAERVDFRLGDATAVIRELPGPFDFVFFDGDRFSAPEQLRLLLPKLARKAFVLHDNALSHREEIAAYLALIESLPEFQHTVVPVGKGLSVAYRG
jgi:predicted O-methyltransferase YrrM